MTTTVRRGGCRDKQKDTSRNDDDRQGLERSLRRTSRQVSKWVIVGVAALLLIAAVASTGHGADGSRSLLAGDKKKHKHSKKHSKKTSKKEKKAKKAAQRKALKKGAEPVCESMFGWGGNRRYELAHSPLLYERDNLMVCRVAKVGSSALRCIQKAYESKSKFADDGNLGCRPKDREGAAQLMDVKDKDEFNKLLYGEETNRIMFVRHPVRRILSGFIQMAKHKGEDFWHQYHFEEDLGYGPEAFHKWILHSPFRFEYDPDCSKASTYFSMEMWSQHWAPPQQCRCGMWDCDVEWKIYKTEEHNMSSVMAEYIPGPWIPEDDAKPVHSHSKVYDWKEYFKTPGVLDFLNTMTKGEQEFFGYEPLTID